MEAHPVEAVAESPSAIWQRIDGLLGELGGGIVEGEVQKCMRASSGHVYIDLTDGEAKISCVIWRTSADKIAELPREGQLVQARYRRIRTYAKNGSVSLDVDAIRGAGEGELLARVHETLARLVAEGLTDADTKLPLPRFPRRVGLVTGRDSDAEADVIRALRDRFPPSPYRRGPLACAGRRGRPEPDRRVGTTRSRARGRRDRLGPWRWQRRRSSALLG